MKGAAYIYHDFFFFIHSMWCVMRFGSNVSLEHKKCDDSLWCLKGSYRKTCHPGDSVKILNLTMTCPSRWQERGTHRAREVIVKFHLRQNAKGEGKRTGERASNHDEHDSFHRVGPRKLRNVMKNTQENLTCQAISKKLWKTTLHFFISERTQSNKRRCFHHLNCNKKSE